MYAIFLMRRTCTHDKADSKLDYCSGISRPIVQIVEVRRLKSPDFNNLDYHV